MRVEYGSYHKFMVSLGIALIGLAFVLPWLYLREPFDLMADHTKLSGLTDRAVHLIYLRQEIVFWITYLLPVISVLCLVVGILCVKCGFPDWRKAQSLEDKTREAVRASLGCID